MRVGRWRTGGFRWQLGGTQAVAAASRASGSQLTSLCLGLPARQDTRQGKGGCQGPADCQGVPQHPDHPSPDPAPSLALHPVPAHLLQQVLSKPRKTSMYETLATFWICEFYTWFCIWWWILVRRKVWVLQQVLEFLLSSVAAPLLPSIFKSPAWDLLIWCLVPSNLLLSTFKCSLTSL